MIRTAGIAAALGFVLTFETSSTRSSNGRLVECSYTNFGALLLGAIAIVTGLVGLIIARGESENRSALLGIAGVAVLVGVLHIFRGLGAVGGPCAL